MLDTVEPFFNQGHQGSFLTGHLIRVISCRQPHVTPVPGINREALAEAAKAQLDWMRQGQALFYKVRQVMLRQRQHLLAHDELSMCSARLSLRGTASAGAMRAQLFLDPPEVRPHTLTTSQNSAFAVLPQLCQKGTRISCCGLELPSAC